MIPLPVSVCDLIKICGFICTTISACITAVEDKGKVYLVLNQLLEIISQSTTHLKQYILYTEQLRSVHFSLERCSILTSKLHEILRPDASSISAFERVKYATFGRWKVEKYMEKLMEQVNIFTVFNNLYFLLANEYLGATEG
jgi:hypothetical protein